MRIQLLKTTLVGKRRHAQGDVVECDDHRAKALIKQGAALKITRISPYWQDPEDEPDGPAEPQIRQAVANPGARKGRPRD